MSGNQASFAQSPSLPDERVFRHAELASATSLAHTEPGPGNEDLTQVDRERLARVAMRELERRAERARLLPDTIVSDIGWLILLDLFVCNAQDQRIALSDSAHRWGVSQGTALRQIVGLIAHGLIERNAAGETSYTTSLQLTRHGLNALSETLRRLA